MAFRNRMAVSRLKYLKKDRPVQELNSSMLEDRESIKNSVTASICLGTSYAEAKKMENHLFHYKFLHLLKREGGGSLSARAASPFVYKASLYGGLYGGGKYGVRDTGSGAGSNVRGGRGGFGGGGGGRGSETNTSTTNAVSKGGVTSSRAAANMSGKADSGERNNPFNAGTPTAADDTRTFGIFSSSKSHQNAADVDGNFDDEDEQLQYAVKVG